jgi:hypothetical protein
MGGGRRRLRLFDAYDSLQLIETRIDMTTGSETGEFMNTSTCKSLDSGAWRELYRAALFEIDETKLPERISQAEKALALRARDLFRLAGDNIEEGEALDDAMYALHALQSRPQSNRAMPHRREAP